MKTAAVGKDEGVSLGRDLMISMKSTTFFELEPRAVEMKRNDFLDQKNEIDHDDDENEMPRKINVENSARFLGCCLADGG